MNGISEDAIRLRAFLFSLRDEVRKWLFSQPIGSFTNWIDMSQTILARYFPLGKAAKLRAKLNTFRQEDNESLYDAWERYKDLKREFPNHGI